MSTLDTKTASAFASSWNNLPEGSVYTREQFREWLEPLGEKHVRELEVLELGCGNASLLVHLLGWRPKRAVGVDLGDSVRSARANLEPAPTDNWEVVQADLTSYESDGFDLVYCIGVLHHLAEPRRGFDAVIRNTKPGGRFHCWVYGHEGNLLVRVLVEPLRRICSKLPWWVTKYLFATPLVVPFFLYAKLLEHLPESAWFRRLPMYDYARWIGAREFVFFRHVAFDQLVTPRTVYLKRQEIERWLAAVPDLEQGSAYVIRRNGNSWKFGGRRRVEPSGSSTDECGRGNE